MGLQLGLRGWLGRHLRWRCSGEDGGSRKHSPAGSVFPEGILEFKDHTEGDGTLARGAARLWARGGHGNAADGLPAAGQSARGPGRTRRAAVAADVRTPVTGQRRHLVIAWQCGTGEVVLGRREKGEGKEGERRRQRQVRTRGGE